MSWLKPVMLSPKKLFMAAFSSDSDKSLFKVSSKGSSLSCTAICFTLIPQHYSLTLFISA